MGHRTGLVGPKALPAPGLPSRDGIEKGSPDHMGGCVVGYNDAHRPPQTSDDPFRLVV